MPLWRKRNKFGARFNIIWEKQLVDPPIHYLTCGIVPWSLVLNKPWSFELIYYSGQLSTIYIFGIFDLRLTREQIENCLCMYLYVCYVNIYERRYCASQYFFYVKNHVLYSTLNLENGGTKTIITCLPTRLRTVRLLHTEN